MPSKTHYTYLPTLYGNNIFRIDDDCNVERWDKGSGEWIAHTSTAKLDALKGMIGKQSDADIFSLAEFINAELKKRTANAKPV